MEKICQPLAVNSKSHTGFGVPGAISTLARVCPAECAQRTGIHHEASLAPSTKAPARSARLHDDRSSAGFVVVIRPAAIPLLAIIFEPSVSAISPPSRITKCCRSTTKEMMPGRVGQMDRLVEFTAISTQAREEPLDCVSANTRVDQAGVGARSEVFRTSPQPNNTAPQMSTAAGHIGYLCAARRLSRVFSRRRLIV